MEHDTELNAGYFKFRLSIRYVKVVAARITPITVPLTSIDFQFDLIRLFYFRTADYFKNFLMKRYVTSRSEATNHYIQNDSLFHLLFS